MDCQVQITAGGFLKRVTERILIEARKNFYFDFFTNKVSVYTKSIDLIG
jgi:hypothetical protein